MVDGDFGRSTRAAVSAWQRSRGWPATGELKPNEAAALVAEGARIRDDWRWTAYRNDQVGYTIGYVGRTFQPSRPRARGGMDFSSIDGRSALSVYVGTWDDVGDFDSLYERMSASSNEQTVVYKSRTPMWFVVTGTRGNLSFYNRWERRASGVAAFIMFVPRNPKEQMSHFITATANAFHVDHDIRPTGAVDTPPQAARPVPQPRPAPLSSDTFLDRTGKTSSMQLRFAGQDPELRASQVFQRVSGAVYKVEAITTQPGTRDPSVTLGSAVAISRQELLTNCHVVQGAQTVVLIREQQMMRADVVSGDISGDRCILRVQPWLPDFVTARPYRDIKIGEPVYAIGAPRELELTLTQGLVSSKRVLDGLRYIQTDAPISKGSSGGGLFDAAGNLVGITTFMRKDAQNLNFAIPADDFMR